MSFRFSSSHSSTSGASRPIKSPKHVQIPASSPQRQFSVPNGPNWVYASGGSRPVRFDFSRALDEQIASEDESCGSSQEYYARKSASSHSKGASTFVPPVLPVYNTDPRLLYPTQRPNYAFNFDRATPADIQNMNTALPFGPMPPPERKQKTRKDIDKAARASPHKPASFEFGSRATAFSAHSPSTDSSTHQSMSKPVSTTLTARSQNHDSHARRTSVSKPHMTSPRRK